MKKKTLLKDIAYEKIKEMILTEDDEYTSENFLVEKLQMSRTPIREALQRLQHDGFIKILPNQGISIPPLSIKEMNDIADYRIAIETTSLKQAIDYITQKDFDFLEELIKKQTEAVNQHDVLLYLKYDLEFHIYLLKVVGNDLFIGEIENVSNRLYRLARKMKKKLQNLTLRIQEHSRIINLLKEKKLDLALIELENHLLTGRPDIDRGI